LTSITTKRPDGQIAEQVKNAQETLGYQKIIVPKIPPGEGGYCQLKVYIALLQINAYTTSRKSTRKLRLATTKYSNFLKISRDFADLKGYRTVSYGIVAH